jgi:hypothetical protein
VYMFVTGFIGRHFVESWSKQVNTSVTKTVTLVKNRYLCLCCIKRCVHYLICICIFSLRVVSLVENCLHMQQTSVFKI